jgi:hypothetical protein
VKTILVGDKKLTYRLMPSRAIISKMFRLANPLRKIIYIPGTFWKVVALIKSHKWRCTMKNGFTYLAGLIILLLTACSPRLMLDAPLEQPGTIYTQSAQTMEAMLTQSSLTMQATLTQAAMTEEPPLPFPTVTASPTPTLYPTIATSVSYCDWVTFVKDVTIPDGAAIKAGETFVKTWRLKNRGTCTWTPDYALVFSVGAKMGDTVAVKLPDYVAPGNTVDISVALTAPVHPGQYSGYWLLRNDSGALFGYGNHANKPIYVEIQSEDVSSPFVTISPSSGSSGTLVQVAASGFPPNHLVLVGLGPVNSEYGQVAQGYTNASGFFSTQVQVQGGAGMKMVFAVAAKGHPGVMAPLHFYITEAIPTPTPYLDMWTTFSSPAFAVSLEYPAYWQPVPGYGDSTTGPTRYGDVNGFFQIGAMDTDSIDKAAANEAEHILQPYGSHPTIENLQIQGQEARLILPSNDQPNGMQYQSALIVRYPFVASLAWSPRYFVLYADASHIRTIAETLRFTN